MSRKAKIIELLAPEAAERKKRNLFAEIPALIESKGRVKGFERLRDLILLNWEELSSVLNPYSAIKLVLETDRHSLFSEISEEKQKDRFHDKKYQEFQEYLKGNIELPGAETPSEVEEPEEDAKNGTKSEALPARPGPARGPDRGVEVPLRRPPRNAKRARSG